MIYTYITFLFTILFFHIVRIGLIHQLVSTTSLKFTFFRPVCIIYEHFLLEKQKKVNYEI